MKKSCFRSSSSFVPAVFKEECKYCGKTFETKRFLSVFCTTQPPPVHLSERDICSTHLLFWSKSGWTYRSRVVLMLECPSRTLTVL